MHRRIPLVWPCMLLGLGSLLVAGALLALRDGPPLQVFPVGCEILQITPVGPICAVANEGPLKLLVVAPDGVRFDGEARSAAVNDRLPTQPVVLQRSKGGEQLVRIAAGSSVIRVGVRTWTRPRARRSRIEVRSLASYFQGQEWLYQARQAWLDGHDQQAEQLLHQHPEVNSGAAGVHRSGVLGAIAAGRGDDGAAVPLLEQAIAGAAKEGLPSEEARWTLVLAQLLAKKGRPDQAESALDRAAAAFAQVPEHGTWATYQRAVRRLERGELRVALSLFDEGMRSAERLGDDEALADLRGQHAYTLATMGRYTEADEEFNLAVKQHDLCHRASILSTQGWARLEAQLTLSHDRWSPMVQDPAPPLLEAERIFTSEPKCDRPWSLANVRTNLAHVANLTGSLKEAAARLDAARGMRGAFKNAAALELQWVDLEGNLALRRRDWDQAEKAFQELTHRAEQRDAYESAWRALIGMARTAQGRGQISQALERYQQAEDYLDRRSLDVPLAAGRGSFLGRFELGTARYVELLVQQDQQKSALQVILYARTRGLRALGVLARVAALPAAQREVWEAKLSDYRKARAELDRLAAELSIAPQSEQRALSQDMERHRSQAMALLEQALAALGPEPERRDFREPADGEAMMTCHPRPRDPGGWYCFVWDRQGIVYHWVHGLDDSHMEQALRGPLRGPLEQARRLVVIPYGPMRQMGLDLLALPAGTGQAARPSLEVVFSLDVPWRPQEPSQGAQGKEALVVCDPQGDAPALCTSTERAANSLAGTRWKVTVQKTLMLGGRSGWQAEQKQQMKGDELRGVLSRADHFLYAGHGAAVQRGVQLHGLRANEESGLWADDILALGRVPQTVLLLGCETGISDEEIGGLEGLGMAQAFLLRGSSWVIGTVRQVPPDLTAAVIEELYLPAEISRLIGGSAGPVGALRDALQRVRQKHPNRDADLSAFRIFIP